MNNGYIIGGVALLCVLVLGMMFPTGNTVVERVVEQVNNLGAAAGPEQTEHNIFYASAGFGGMYHIATSASAVTYTDAIMRDNSVLSFADSGSKAAALAVTLPASTTWPSLAKLGVVQSWIVDNNFGAAGTTTTITAGTGVDIDGTGANDDVINGGTAGLLSCWREYDTDVRCIVQEMVDAG